MVTYVVLLVNDNDAMIDGFTIVGGRADTPTYHTIEGVYTLRGTSGGGLLALAGSDCISWRTRFGLPSERRHYRGLFVLMGSESQTDDKR
jgi:hypothetical protein